MKYIIDFAKSFDKAQQFNASKKAPAAPMTFFDIEKVMGKVIGKKNENQFAILNSEDAVLLAYGTARAPYLL